MAGKLGHGGTLMERFAHLLGRGLSLEGFDAPENRAAVRAGLALAALAMLLRIVFWAVTNRYWEDSLITCLHSENFAAGLGLTHVRPGEPPLHGFTSPLSVLVPLVADMIRIGLGLEFIKLVSIPAAALTVVYAVALGIHPSVRLSTPLTLMVAGFLAVEHHQILFGMAGMETQIATLILVMSFYHTVAWKPLPLGISLGLCMLARPDFAFWTVIAGVYGLLHDRKRLFTVVIPVALALYLPWILFTTLYYGSPVPHTILAKGLGYVKWYDAPGALGAAGLVRHTWTVLGEQLLVMLGPTFCGHGGSFHAFFSFGKASPVGLAMGVFALAGAALCATRRRRALWPVAGFAAVYSFYYVYLVPIIFTWYKMPYLAALALLAAAGLDAALSRLAAPWRLRTQAAVAAAWVGLFAAVLPVTFPTERQIQRDIENPVRRAAGEYLRDRMQPDEAVGGEPLGYMGYYSRGNVYDWPGLDSRAVVDWSRKTPQARRSLENMLRELKPEYLFLRDAEVLYSFQMPAWLRTNYHPVAAFLADPEKAERIRWIETSMDVQYRIYKKNRPDDPKPYDQGLWPAAPPVNFRDVDRIFIMGAYYAQENLFPQSVAHYRRVTELAPGHLDAWHDLAVVLLRAGQRDAARAAAAEIPRRGGRPDPVLVEALKD